MSRRDSSLWAAVEDVVVNDNCSGCGLCATLSEGIEMQLSEEGYLRPVLTADHPIAERGKALEVFKRACPGRTVVAPQPDAGSKVHPIFGRHLGVWEGWSTDHEIRNAGSSGGLLTTIAAFISEKSGTAAQVVRMDGDRPTRSVPVRIMSREEALLSAGSRYAPVAVAGESLEGAGSVTGKPCEISAIRAAADDQGDGPVLLSFFCAGTPSQKATDKLVVQLGHEVDALTSMRYRGDGWPGNFVVTSSDGTSAHMGYEESWGAVLGKQLQGRCKSCVDGTGEGADIAVGDYWAADEKGYPVFEDQDGRSVVIARTMRGQEILIECAAAGLIEISPVRLDSVSKIQPLQVKRRLTLPGRLLGKRLTGQRIPEYRGYGLFQGLVRRPVMNLKAAAGTLRRSLRKHSRS